MDEAARRRLCYLALCICDEAWVESGKAPVERGYALRVALGVLHHLGGASRATVNEFWKIAGQADLPAGPTVSGIGRSAHLSAYIIGMARDAGVAFTTSHTLHRPAPSEHDLAWRKHHG